HAPSTPSEGVPHSFKQPFLPSGFPVTLAVGVAAAAGAAPVVRPAPLVPASPAVAAGRVGAVFLQRRETLQQLPLLSREVAGHLYFYSHQVIAPARTPQPIGAPAPQAKRGARLGA